MPSAPFPPTSRRAVVGGTAAGLVALTGCDLTEPGQVSSPAPSPAAPDPDRELADLAASEIAATLALVTTASARDRRLARLLDGLATAHEAHLEVLGPPGKQQPAATLPRSTARALDEVLRRERATQRRLAGWAVEAASGQLARLLASMSAAVGQHVAVADRDAALQAGAVS